MSAGQAWRTILSVCVCVLNNKGVLAHTYIHTHIYTHLLFLR